MTDENFPKAFMSYSWDGDEHKAWVSTLSTRLRADGVDVKLDQWHAIPGDQLPEFMEREIRENDFVIIVCTPKYKAKSDSRTGGVGYEGDVMTAELISGRENRKFIPILASGTWQESAPSWLAGKYYIDLSREEKFEVNYEDLLNTVCGTRAVAPPVVRSERQNQRKAVASGQVPEIAPIKILGVVVDEVTRPKNDGTTGSALYKVPFRLSRTPTHEWATLFVASWNRPPRYTSMHRPGIASVRGDKIFLDGTTVQEVEKYHRETLMLCVDSANENEARFLADQKRKADAQRQTEKVHREEVEEASKRLKFD
ncbi:MAG: toll/interleukin-1 receptor domain-containing protein [Candidatus Sabulitectum sp.]|nr:toll/interleukin-1 receptor domain-containing protein [Candidatus Sabulitectum sp.]